MNIAIFGDSFGVLDYPKACNNLPYFSHSWLYKLHQKHKVTEYSLCATGPEWSYLQLQQKEVSGEIDKFDKIIFLVADPFRLILEESHQTDPYNFHILPYPIPEEKRSHRTAYNQFIKFFAHDRIFRNKTNCIAENIKLKYGNDALVIYSSAHLMPDYGYQDGEISLQELERLSIRTWLKQNKINTPRKLDRLDKLFMHHLNCANNLMLYDKIETWLESGHFSLTKKDAQIFNNKSVEAGMYLNNCERP